MAKSYCRRCDNEKSTNKGDFCPYCMVYTETYYAEPQVYMKTYEKGLKKTHKKTKKLSENIFGKTHHEVGLKMLHQKTKELSENISRKNSLEMPLTNKYPENFTCIYCGKNFTNQKELEKHVASLRLMHLRFKPCT